MESHKETFLCQCSNGLSKIRLIKAVSLIVMLIILNFTCIFLCRKPRLLLLFSGKMHLVTEFCSGGSLRKLLIDSRVYSSSDHANMVSTLNQNQLLKVAVDIANGMAHLSSQKVLVRLKFQV